VQRIGDVGDEDDLYSLFINFYESGDGDDELRRTRRSIDAEGIGRRAKGAIGTKRRKKITDDTDMMEMSWPESMRVAEEVRESWGKDKHSIRQ
jgi:hypothetical protein